MSSLFQQDPFKRHNVIKWFIVLVFGWLTYFMLQVVNRTRVKGTEHLEQLPDQNVLFVSNHQTYFLDVIALYHIFSASKHRMRDSISNPLYLFWPRLNSYFVAAEETAKSGVLARVGSYLGAVLVRRTWREKNRKVKRPVRFTDVENIAKALGDGWVITFPQGTTRPNAPGRKGVAHIIKDYEPKVVPVVITGFRETFFKKALMFKRVGKQIDVRFKKPLKIDYTKEVDGILKQIMESIEQANNLTQ